MALSRDRSTQAQAVDQGYGLVCDIEGVPFSDLIVSQVNQEHGVITIRPGSNAALPDFPIGTRLRVLPNHACATAAQFDAYRVLEAGGETLATWPRFRGW
jgi:D-serine deaminase-like pyridoxal phosphate-dependent protein